VKIESLFWDLSVLSRAVLYSNLSSASRHIGLSQPQISRIVKKIEEELDVQILDREAKRKSAWTRTALDISDQFTKGSKELTKKVESAAKTFNQNEIRIATLEGLSPLAISLSHELLATNHFERVDLDVHDIGDLEDHFLRGHYDVIFTFREPGNRKFRYIQELGYQRLQTVEKSKDVFVGNHLEARTLDNKKNKIKRKYLISNSLLIRREWLEKWGGHGNLPAEIHPNKVESQRDQLVLIVGADDLPRSLWDIILTNSKRRVPLTKS